MIVTSQDGDQKAGFVSARGGTDAGCADVRRAASPTLYGVFAVIAFGIDVILHGSSAALHVEVDFRARPLQEIRARV